MLDRIEWLLIRTDTELKWVRKRLVEDALAVIRVDLEESTVELTYFLRDGRFHTVSGKEQDIPALLERLRLVVGVPL